MGGVQPPCLFGKLVELGAGVPSLALGEQTGVAPVGRNVCEGHLKEKMVGVSWQLFYSSQVIVIFFLLLQHTEES